MKSLFEYTSYRFFLKDSYLREKLGSKKANLATYARCFDMSAPAFNMILQGTRNLTPEKTHLIARELRLSPIEHEYFETLVLMNQTEDRATISFYKKRLKRIYGETTVKNVRISHSPPLEKWYIPALLIYLVDFELAREKNLNLETLDFTSIAQRFQISEEELKKCIAILKKTGLLETDKNDRVHIVFDKLVANSPQKRYLKSVAQELIERIETDFEKKHSLFRSFVFTMYPSHLPEIRSELIALFEKYMASENNPLEEPILFQAITGVFPALQTNDELNHLAKKK